MIERIFIDLDGVVTQFVETCINVMVDPKENLTVKDFMRYEIHTTLGMTIDQFWTAIRSHGYRFWAEMPAYKWAGELLRECKRLCPNMAFLSSPGIEPSAAMGKMVWVKKHYPGVPLILTSPSPEVPTAKLKAMFAQPGSLLIDDSLSNCDAWQACGGQTILWPAPWNARSAHTGWDNWIVVRKHLEDLAHANA